MSISMGSYGHQSSHPHDMARVINALHDSIGKQQEREAGAVMVIGGGDSGGNSG